LKLFGYSVQSDDDAAISSSVKSSSSGTVETTVQSTPQILFAMRLQSAFKGGLRPLNYQLFSTSGNSVVYFRLMFNPSIVGATWAPAPTSIAETLTGYTSFTPGLTVGDGYVSAGATADQKDITVDTDVGRAIDGTADIVAIVAQTLSSHSPVLYSVDW